MIISLPLWSALVLGALTPAKVDNVTAHPSAMHSAKPPSIIYVDTFSVSGATPQADSDDSSGGGLFGNRPHLFQRRKEQQQEDTLTKLPALLQKELVRNLSDAIALAAAGDGSDATSHSGWIITGQFIVVDTGSSALQAGVGLGAGQSKVEVRAQVCTLGDTANPFLVFDSKGASGHMPGYAMMMNPYVAAAKFVMSKKEPEKETKKIAKAIAQEIGKFMVAQGIPTLKQVQNAGEMPAAAPPSESSKGARSDVD